jgi:hypothetical protein
VSETCWVCRTRIEDREVRVPARGVPHRLRAFEGKPVHLRCHGEWDGVAAPAPGASRADRAIKPLADGQRLFAHDIAVTRGISARQARRWLARLEIAYGVAVVGRIDGRRGPRRFTTAAALETIGPSLGQAEAEILNRITSLEARVAHLEIASQR